MALRLWLFDNLPASPALLVTQAKKSELIGMPKEKYDPPDPRRIYTIMSAEEVANGKKSHWAELEISGRVRSLSTSLWSLTHLTALHLNDNYLSRIPPDIAKLHNLVYLDLSSNKLRSLPAELGNMVSLRFTLVQKHTVEFNQVAMANSDGSEAMLNRVMTKDNIGVAVVLEVHKELFGAGMKPIHAADKQLLIVANAHMHWDPEYSDVKLIQTMMFVSEVKNILEKASSRPGSPTADPNSIPLVLCADLNSLPDSGVVEYLSNGGVADNHKDFKELRYNECLMNFSCNGKNGSSEGRITHGFQLKSAYENNLMPYTNYTFDFKGVIDYIFYSKTHMNVLGVLGPLDPQWLVENNITGCPHPHIPSDHFSLLTQLELHPPLLPLVNGVHLPNRR
ncbi:hypothetical protein E2I00_011983 [Balaenoptera physalus]|uniref:poly(A)-specific ribonuclease n=1 Tax=Balaenoptera physalus TaxID=9770 RepID=A0A643BY50_BALPH|nr:hypothetical protein E2I00_011983 [Balaenoptera physalus]